MVHSFLLHLSSSKNKKRLKLTNLIFLQLPPVPPPPPFPEGYAPPSTAEASENQQAETQLPTVDPIIDQGPSKRMKV